jgi:hypothetical protein
MPGSFQRFLHADTPNREWSPTPVGAQRGMVAPLGTPER